MTRETISKYCREFVNIEAQIKELEARQKVIKQKLIENLSDNNMPTKYEVGIKEVAPTTIFDSARFRHDNPSMYNDYRTKAKSGYITVKVVEL